MNKTHSTTDHTSCGTNFPEDSRKVRARNGHVLIEDAMKARGVRGNPKDYVVLMHHNQVVDSYNAYTVRASLPPDDALIPGVVVCVRNREGQLRPVAIIDVAVADSPKHPDAMEGLLNPNPEPGLPSGNETQWMVSNGKAQWWVRRDEMFPTAIPNAPALVHKRDLWQYVGEKWADLFWNKAAGMRRVKVPVG